LALRRRDRVRTQTQIDILLTDVRELRVATPRPGIARRVELFVEREWVLVAVSALFLASSAIAARAWMTADGWFDIVYAREIVQHGFLHGDTLTIMGQGHAWVDQQWLGQLVLYAFFVLGGPKLTVLATAFVYSLAFALALALARRRGASALAMTLVGLLVWLYATTWVQTEAFSHVLFVVVLSLLAGESRRRSRRILLVFPLLVLWANLHGAVVLGAGLVALLGAVELWHLLRAKRAARLALLRAMGLLVVPWLCVFATPYGFSVAQYYRATILNPAFHDYLGPWMPPTPFTVVGGPFFLLAVGAIVAVARRYRQLTAYELAVLAVTLAGALEAQRAIMWFGFACLLFLPPLVERGDGRHIRTPSARIRLGFAAAALVLLVGALAEAFSRPQSYYLRAFPNRASTVIADYVRAHHGARVFATDRFSDWLVYEQPSLWGKVAYDARWEELTPTQIRDVFFFTHQYGADWERPALGYRLLVIAPEEQPWLVRTFERRQNMRVLYRGPKAIVFERT
jgi:hypothetical protein